MSNANHDDSKPLGFGSSAELGPVPAVPFCRVRDVANPGMCAMVGQDPDAPLFTAEQLRAEVAAERERWSDAVRALMCSDIGVQTRHKLEAGQGTNTLDGQAWLRALQMLREGPNAGINAPAERAYD